MLDNDSPLPSFYLLTHPRELERPTGTGQWVKQALGNQCHIIPWHRREPSEWFTTQLKPTDTALIYPGMVGDHEDASSADPAEFKQFIIIDGTWQEARKIYNHSPYLHPYPHITLTPSSPSCYRLRRNQVDGGLSTIETVTSLLETCGPPAQLEKIATLIQRHLKTRH